MPALLILAAVVFGGLRVAGLFDVFAHVAPFWFQAFKDAAHLYTGGLIGAWLVGWWVVRLLRRTVAGWPYTTAAPVNRLRLLCGWLAVALSVLEVACAVASRIAR